MKYDFPIHLLAAGSFLYELGVIAQYFIRVVWRFDTLGGGLRHEVSLSPLLACLFPEEGSIFIFLGFFFGHSHRKCLCEGGRRGDVYINVYTSLKMLQCQMWVSSHL